MIYSADFWIKKRKELWDEKKDIELDSQMRKALAKEIIENKVLRKEVIAFGDNYNDLDMLKFAGMGVVMGNADEAVKEQGDYVTSTNTEDGVAKAIYKFLGI